MKAETRLFQANWVLGACLLLLPPLGLLFLWFARRDIGRRARLALSLLTCVWLLFFTFGVRSFLQEEPEAPPIYATVEIRDVLDGAHAEKIGEYSLIRAEESAVTEQALTDWYYNYVAQNDFKWCMILYSDRSDFTGVYAIYGIVQKDVVFTPDAFGEFVLSEADATKGATIFIPADDGQLRMHTRHS